MRRDFFKLFGLSKEPVEEHIPFKVELPGNQNDGGVFNPHSKTWSFIRTLCKESIDKLHEKNDKVNLTVEKTSFIRGQISTFKEILKLPETTK